MKAKKRILILSHPAILPIYREKFERLAAFPDLELRVITPTRWFEGDQRVTFEPLPDAKCPIHPRPIWFSGYGSRFFYTSGVSSHFSEFQPEVIHLEEEPWSLCALQTWWFRRRFCSTVPLILRTSPSFWMQQRFGVLPRLIESRVLRATAFAFPLSRTAGQVLERKGYRGECEPMPNGVDVSRFVPADTNLLRRQLRLEGHFVIGYVGRLLWMKGLDLLLRACASLNAEWRLLLVGSGEFQGALERLSAELGIADRIVWAGAVSGECVPDYMNCMDTLVLPSRTTPEWVEFFGRVLVEAMATRLPVIGSSSGQIPEVIGDAGLIFEEENVPQLADKLMRLIRSPALRHTLAERGYARAHTHYSWQRIAERTRDVYLRLAIEGKSS